MKMMLGSYLINARFVSATDTQGARISVHIRERKVIIVPWDSNHEGEANYLKAVEQALDKFGAVGSKSPDKLKHDDFEFAYAHSAKGIIGVASVIK